MADELPDLVPYPGDAPSSSNLQHAAKWAADFGGSGTNLAQRRRHNQDISAYTAALIREQEARQAMELQNNAKAQNFYFKTKELERKQKNDKALLNERDQRMRFAEELHPLALEAKQAQTAASLARERAAVEATSLKSRIEQRRADDTTLFQKELSTAFDAGIEPGTPDAARAAARARLKAPYVDSALFDDMVKSFGLTPEDVQAEAARLKESGLNARVSSTGNISVATKPEPLPKPEAAGKETVRITTGKDGKPVVTQTTTRPLQPVGVPATETPSQVVAATRPIFKDKNGNRAYRNADGTFEPIQ